MCTHEFERRAAKLHDPERTRVNIWEIERWVLVFRKAYRYSSLDVVWIIIHTVGYVDDTHESDTQSDKARS